jgi:uncharacterized protein (DUF2235 family)
MAPGTIPTTAPTFTASARPAGLRSVVTTWYYDKGVGLEHLRHLSGAALGRGLSENARQAYRWLVEMYSDGVEIFIFGFSRGAYTARSLTGFKSYSGLLQSQDKGLIEDAYEAYR